MRHGGDGPEESCGLVFLFNLLLTMGLPQLPFFLIPAFPTAILTKDRPIPRRGEFLAALSALLHTCHSNWLTNVCQELFLGWSYWATTGSGSTACRSRSTAI